MNQKSYQKGEKRKLETIMERIELNLQGKLQGILKQNQNSKSGEKE